MESMLGDTQNFSGQSLAAAGPDLSRDSKGPWGVPGDDPWRSSLHDTVMKNRTREEFKLMRYKEFSYCGLGKI